MAEWFPYVKIIPPYIILQYLKMDLISSHLSFDIVCIIAMVLEKWMVSTERKSFWSHEYNVLTEEADWEGHSW